MSNIFKSLFFIVFNFYLISHCFGQTKILKVDSLARQKTEYVKGLLNLDESQFKKWLRMETNYLISIDTLQRIGRSSDSTIRRDKVRLMGKEREMAVINILSKEQLELYLSRKQLIRGELESKLKEFKIPVNN